MSRSRADWIQTFTGRQYWPAAPHPDDIDIKDIAHALSHECRYGGHCRKFYSVAEHSYWVSALVPREHAFVALLHDAPEAYIKDIPRPIKRSLPDYRALEDLNWGAIAAKFSLPIELPDCVHHADIAMLLSEQRALMPIRLWDQEEFHIEPAQFVPLCWPPAKAKQMFLNRYMELHG